MTTRDFTVRARFSRREMLRYGLASAAGLAFAPYAAHAGDKANAKAVIQIWMWGGPCHLDTFDPKPEAGSDFAGPLNKPVPTKTEGLRICELLPLLAQQSDKYSVIRSMTHEVNSHETASYIVQTGHMPDRLSYPNAGAVVSLFRGYGQGYKGMVAPYVVLTELQGRFSEAGFLGPRYKPFATGGDPGKPRFAVDGIVAEGISDQRQRDRRELMHVLDTLGAAMPEHPRFQQLNRCEDKAYELILGESGKLFDLNGEKPELRERYGRNTFGQSCLMARRLVEQGVPFVTINYKGWDTHKQHFEIMRRKLPEMDKGLSALLQDLSDRGLLDSTIVWWGGEFGRTPRVQWEAPWNGGRGHFGNCFCSLLAGGGFKGGTVVGASNKTGEEVVERPVHPSSVIASIYQRLGINPDASLPNARGLDVRVMPQPADVPGTARLTEIM